MKRNTLFTILWVLSILIVFADLSFSQSTTIKLATTDSTSSFNVTKSDSIPILQLFGDGGFYIGGTLNSGSIPITGAGTRLMWYPGKAAFRAGYVGTQWDDTNIGYYSTAMGYNTTASGIYSTAMGLNTTASGTVSTAMGYFTTASGNYSTATGYLATASGIYSTAMGYLATASGIYSTAMGSSTTASGSYSTAMGRNTNASGSSSTAMGLNTTASGSYSTAMGRNTTASGSYSTAMGNYVSTNLKTGSFIIGDRSTTSVTNSSASNEMTMRFDGGYRLFTKSDLSIGVSMANGDNAWASISDSTKKENFVYADGEYFLSSLSKLRLGSWNYKSQDPKEFRHYGPMAQEIFYYFGKDKFGTIGNDTTLSTADMDGIIMICLQELTKRTNKDSEKITEMKEQISSLKAKLSSQKANLVSQTKINSAQGNAIQELRDELLEMKEIVNNFRNDSELFSEAKVTDSSLRSE